jgi:hypothetical protein
MTKLDKYITDAIDGSLDGVIDIVTSDAVVAVLDAKKLRPEEISFDMHAIESAAHFAFSKLKTSLREKALSEIALSRPDWIRKSGPGDGTAVLITRIDEIAHLSDKVIKWTDTQKKTLLAPMGGSIPTLVSVNVGAALNDVNLTTYKNAAATAIKDAICNGTVTLINAGVAKIKEEIEKLKLVDFLKEHREEIKKLTVAAIAAIASASSSQLIALLLIGLAVFLIGAAIYYIACYALPAYCSAPVPHP